MTEDDAKTKWCPFTRLVAGREHASGASLTSSTAPAFNRISIDEGNGVTTPHASKCIASACMAWRVHVEASYQENVHNSADRPEGEGWEPGSPGKKNLWWWRQIPERATGYCGLAGAIQ